MKKCEPKFIENILALIPMQEGMLFHYLKDPQSGLYFEQLTLGISGEIDAEIFEKAWNSITKCNEMLRTVFRWEKLENPSQIILKEYPCKVICFDLSGKDHCQKMTILEEIKNSDRLEVFDLAQVPFRVILCKLTEKQYEMIISNHHILYDGWSTGIILEEFFMVYHGLRNSGQSFKLPVKTPFKEFIKWIQNLDRGKQRQFWREYLAGFDSRTELPLNREKQDGVKAVGKYPVTLGREIKDQLDDFVKENRVTLATVFYTAWGILLQKFCGSEDVIFGTTVSGRSARIKGIEKMVGLFINTIPLRVQSSPGEKILETVLRIDKELQAREEFEYTPLVDIGTYCLVESGGPLFDTIVVIENYPLDNLLVPADGSLSINSYAAVEMTHYDLTVAIIPAEDIKIDFIYHWESFDNDSVENLARLFMGIIQKVVENPGVELFHLEIISREEKERILYDYNYSYVEYPEDMTIHGLFEEQAKKTPDRLALLGPSVSLKTTHESSLHELSFQITYNVLNEKSNHLAQLLRSKGLERDSVVGLMMERSIELITWMLGIMKAGGAYLPIDLEYPRERIDFMLKDSGTQIMVGDRHACPQKLNCQLSIVDYELLMGTPRSIFHHSNHLAYVIYTSGSTGKPKGVMLEHRNLVNLLKFQFKYTNLDCSRILQFTTICFDVSFQEIFSALLSGGQLFLVNKETRTDIPELFKLIDRNQIYTVFLPISFLKIIFREEEYLEQIPLCIKHIQSAGEQVVIGNNFRRYLRESKVFLHNHYGPAETHVVTTLAINPEGEIPELPSIGKPIQAIGIFILDKGNHLLPLGAAGELWIGGAQIGRGYLNRPELTAERFIMPSATRNPFEKEFLNLLKLLFNKHLPFYRTGDLARRLPDGNIEFLGRIDHQVKIRGFRVELGEIENRLSNYPKIKQSVITSRVDGKGDRFLCAYIVTNSVFSISELREYLVKELPDYMIPAYFVQIDSIPLTPNGKIDRKALPEPKLGTERVYIVPCDDIENKLRKIWSEVLQIDESKIGVLENFFKLGGHSLKAMVLTAKIHKEFNTKVPLSEIFKRMSIRGLAQYIRGVEKERPPAIEPTEKKWFYPLSFAQKRLYFLQLMEEMGTGYNMSQIMRLEGNVEVGKLENTFRKIIQRHESFRTSFCMVDEEPVQRVHDRVEFEIEYKDLATDEHGQTRTFLATEGKIHHHSSFIIHHFIRAFDLSKAPLLRVGLVKLEETEFLLMVDMHHIISDGVSLGVLVKEFMALYEGQKLPQPRLQYKDYAEWEKLRLETIVRQEAFWLKEFGEFEDGIPVLDLPLDYVRPRVQSFEGCTISFGLGIEEIRALNALALKQEATLFMVLLAVYDIFLAKISNREVIVVVTPTAGRDHADLENIIGIFVNTLALKNVPSGEKSFLLFLEEVKENTLNAFANQKYPYEKLVEKIITDRDAGRNPLFDTMFTLQNLDFPTLEIPGLKLKPYPYEQSISKFDLTLECTEIDGRLSCIIEYCTRLFKRETILRFTGYFERVIAAVLEAPGEKISGIEIISEDEKKQLLFHFNDTFVDYPRDKTIHGLFEEHAAKTPAHAAVFCHGRTRTNTDNNMIVTYRELDEHSSRLAYLLIEKGVLADNIVAIMIERSIEMVIGIIGILKAGAGYLPIDPEYPRERIEYMLRDSNAMVIIDKKFFGGPYRRGDFSKMSPGRRRHFHHSNHLAYVIYTSGSTGRPKGVMVTHRPVVNRLYFVKEKYRLDESDVVLQKTNYTFDVSVCELFRWILPGAKLCLCPAGGENQPEVIINSIVKYNVSTIDFVPSMLNAFLEFVSGEGVDGKLRTLRWVFTGAEVVRPELVTVFNKVLAGRCNAQLIDAYGPTEATVDVTFFNCSGGELLNMVPIGKPLANVRVFILDKAGHLQPIGIAGELYIGGASLATGYLNNSEITAEKFINKSFVGVQGGLFQKPPLVYRTGDLARWLVDGNIEFMGRIDEQVKIRGFRVEPGEIEGRLLGHEKVKEAVVVVNDQSAGVDKYLCAYIVPVKETGTDEIDLRELRTYLSRLLPEYMLPTFFVQLEKIPLTSGGKVDRKALPRPTRKTVDHYAAPQNDIEKKLVEIWSEVLGISSIFIGIDDSFFELGGHSLKATILVAKLHKTFAVKIPLVEIFKTPFIRDIARMISKSQKLEFVDLPPVEEKDSYELSFNQKRLWFLQQMESGSSAFNMPGKIMLEHPVEAEWIERTLKRIFQRHEGFRTGFKIIKGEPVQFIVKKAGIVLNKVDLSSLPEQEKQHARDRIFYELAAEPFDLTQAPLFRAGLLKLANGVYEFIFNMHHIISDGLSMEILKDEFSRLYEGYREGWEILLEPVKFHYKDFAAWHNCQLADPLWSESSLRFWINKLEKGGLGLELPGDFSAGNKGNNRAAATWRLMIGNDLKDKLKELAGATNTTLFMTLFSAYLLLLYRLSGRQEVACSIIDSGREHPSLHRVIGFFINSLIFKTTIVEEESFWDFLRRTGGDVLDVFQHRSYPLELVFEKLNMKYPDIPASFNLLNMQDDTLRDELTEFTPLHTDNYGEAKFVMEPYLSEFKNGIDIHWVYKKGVFKAETMAYIASAYIKTLEEISQNPSLPVSRYRIFPAPDAANVNGNRVRPVNEFPEFKKEDTRQSIGQRFEAIVKAHPDKVAVKVGAAVLTYDGLNRFVNRVAALLLIGDRSSRVVALLFDRSIEMLAGIMGVLKAGKMYAPLDPSYPVERLEYMLKDLQAGLIVTGNDHTNLAAVLKNAAVENIEIININRDAVGEDQNPGIPVSPGELAYILYTSGSTGKPKGVMQSHGNVLHFARVYANALHIHPWDRLTLFSSYCFDAAKMDIFGALLNGATLYPFDIKKEESLSSLPNWLNKEKITIFHSIPTVYRYFTDQLGPIGKNRFSSLRLIVLGGEAVYIKDVDNYKRYFPDHCLFINGLGPTESTVTLQYFIDKEMEISKRAVPVGFPVEDTHVFIMNDKEEARVFEVGELVYKSDYLAVGYWCNPEKTREVFMQDPLTGTDRVYRSGDLGRRLPNGMIEYVGRKDFQVKVRGYRIELSEIEGALDRLEGIKKSVVVCQQDAEGESYLVAYYQVEPGFGASMDEARLFRHLQGSLPGYMMPNAFYQMEEFSLTATGKIDRKALGDRIVSGELRQVCHTPPRDALEGKLAEIWANVLGLAAASIGIDDNFFEQGGHSLKAVVLAAKIHQELNVKIPLAEVFKSPSIRLLSKYIESEGITRYAAIEPVEKREYYALSAAQKRLYVLQQFDLNSTAYNLPSILPLGREIDRVKLEHALKCLIARHESLRTSFERVNDEVMQRVHQNVEFEIEYYNLATDEHGQTQIKVFTELFSKSDPPEAIIKSFIKPFDLSKAPLIRSGLIKMADGDHAWLVDVHHIVSDGTSHAILAEDFMAMYNGMELGPLRIQYKDFVQWQNRFLESGEIKAQKEYWLELFEGEIPCLDLVADYKRPEVFTLEGGYYVFKLEKEEAEKFKTMGVRDGGTLYMNILAALNILFYKYTGQVDIIIGSGVAGRRHADLQRMVGMFVNTLAMRNYPQGEIPYERFLKEVIAHSIKAFENQDVQFEDLVEELDVARDPSRNPVFDIMMVVQNFLSAGEGILPQGYVNGNIEYNRLTSKFDMTFFVREMKDEVYINIEYYRPIFKQETIERMASYFKNIVKAVDENPGIKLKDIEIISEEEKRKVLVEFNETAVDYPRDKTLHELFEEQMARAPDRIAIVGATPRGCPDLSVRLVSLTYSQLNEQSARLANVLIEKGILADNIVGIMMERSIEMMIGIIGILKAGAAYLPLDLEYPRERINYMLTDSNALAVIDKKFFGGLGGDFSKKPPDRRRHFHHSNHLAYIIYTSGTAGRPKGVMIEHRSAVNLCYWHNRYYRITVADNASLYASFGFDAAVWELFPYLIKGAALYLVDDSIKLDIEKLNAYYAQMDITVSFLPTQFCEHFMEIPNRSLRLLLTGGDKLRKTAIRGEYDLYNNYGPTENAVVTTAFKVCEREDNILIGTPVDNIAVYILDRESGFPQPLGVGGELCISGTGLARGYLNRVELTAERFNMPSATRGSFEKSPLDPTKLLFSQLPLTTNHSALYRTGDLARWLSDGNIEFLGRIDEQVKIRGFRIELGEIEAELMKHEALEHAVVVALDNGNGDKYLCGYIVTSEIFDVAELKGYLAGKMPGYMIPAYLVKIAKIPMTPSGKIDRKALPAPLAFPSAAYTPPRDNLERELVEIWTEVLGRDSTIGIDDNFFERGGHSLKATSLAAKIHKAVNVKVPLAEIFKAPRIRELAEYIRGMIREQYVPIMLAEEKEYYTLSPAQKRLYILQQLTVANTSYNMPYAIPLAGDITKEKLESVFQTLLCRNESLRTSFETINEEPVQRIHKEVEFSIRDYTALGEEEMGTVIANFTEPFDLSKAPLIRVAFLTSTAAPGRQILLLDMHHIITDGVSQEILTKELSALMAGESLPLPKLQYRDYSEWYHGAARMETIKRQEVYWLKQFAGEVPILALPTDYPRPAVQRFEGQSKWFGIAKVEMETLKKLALDEGATLFMVLESLFVVVLSRLSNQEDILVGTPVAGREHADLQNVTGMFVNILVLWNHLPGELTFREFLRQVKEKTLEAFENQDYPFEVLVEHVAVNRDMGRNPLFDVVFSLQDTAVKQGNGNWCNNEVLAREESFYEYKSKTSKFDLTLTAIDGEEESLFRVEYSTRLFTEETIERIINYFKQVVWEVVDKSDKQVSALEIISLEEKQRILFEFNEMGIEYPNDKTIHGLFGEQAAKTPDHIAVFCHGRTRTNTDHNSLTYRELYEQSNRLAGLLIEKGVEPNTVVAILMERSIDMIIGILGILKAGGAYLPINPGHPGERVEYMLKDSNALAVIDKKFFGNLYRWDDFLKKSPGRRRHFHHPSHLAYIIYTSGSAGKPKGVPITHANFSPLLHWGYCRLGIGVNDRTIQNLSYYFDWSVWEIFITLTTGAGLYMVSEDKLPVASGGIEFINHYGITILHVTPTQCQYIFNGLTALVTLRYLFIGAEKLTHELVERSFAAVGGNCRVFNMYGPTEVTIISAVLEIHRENLTQFTLLASIPIGRAAGNTAHLILDKYRNICPVTIAGELYIRGDGIAMGYLNNPELTCEKFKIINDKLKIKNGSGALRADFHRSSFIIHHSIFYRTGDLARWLPDGNIEFLGRIDNQVKIRGFRIELGEIENRLVKHTHIKDAVVIDRKDEKGDPFLTAYIVPTQPIDTTELRNALSKSLPNYMIPSYFVPIEAIPLTPNGKLNKDALPVPSVNSARFSNGRECQPSTDKVETQLAAVWREVLKLDGIGINDNFFELGGHSLKAITLISMVKKEFHVDVPLRIIFEKPTVREQAQYIKESGLADLAVVEPVEKKEYYPLSASQRKLFIFNRVEKQEIIYNLPGAVTVYGELNLTNVENVLKELIQRHESLRTSFHIINDLPVQKVQDSVEFEITYYDFATDEHGQTRTKVFGGTGTIFQKGSCPPEVFFKLFIRPFDLTQAPLLRAGLLKIEKARHILIVDMHHIISDGVSAQLFINEFCRLYAGERLEELTVQYKDFAQWQGTFLQSERLAKQKSDWMERFSGEIPILTMPIDFPRPRHQSFEGDKIDFEIDEELTKQVRGFAGNNGVTLYMALLSIFTILLSRYSGQEDIIVGSPSAGRRHTGSKNILGMFVNTLAMRNYPRPTKRFIDFLEEVKQNSLAAFENQDYPFDNLVNDLTAKREAGRNPLFDVMFALQNIETEEIAIKGLVIKPYKLLDKIAKFDINLHCWEDHDKLYGSLRYCTKLFQKESMLLVTSHFVNIMREVVKNYVIKLSEIKMLSLEEVRRLLYDFNNTGTDYSRNKTVSQIFEEQVGCVLDKIAVKGPILYGGRVRDPEHGNLHITYKELNEKSGRLAGVLIQKGVEPDIIVGIMMDRSLEMIIGIMGILKSGGAYLPLDPEYPRERINYMLKDSGAQIIVGNRHACSPELNCQLSIVNCELLMSELAASFHHSSYIIHHSSLLAYLIYTSGSTGTPKGVMIQNNNLVNYIHWFVGKASFTDSDSVVLTTTISFDAGYTYIFASLLKGGCLHIIPKVVYLIPEEFLNYINKHQITFLKLIPSLFSTIIDSADFSKEKLQSVRLIMLGGEAINPTDVEKAHGACPHLRIMNHYGPTEVTIGCIAQYIDFNELEEYKNTPTIGKPIDNNRVYILNKHMALLPIGVPGELYLAGEGVARGYLNRPELTNDKFKIKNGSGTLRADLNAFGDEENFHHSSFIIHHSILYCTGDLARWLPDGNIEFLGRADHQVKIRGHRIELAEIEQVLLAHPRIKECVVVVGKDAYGNNYLTAYYVEKDGTGENTPTADLHEFLSKKLPVYMIPSFFILLKKFPLNLNGKIERNALPKPSGSIATGRNYKAPANAMEESLVKVWQEILKVNKIGIHDNFFQLGGDSIKAIQVSSRLQTYGLKLETRDFFANPVVSELVKHVTPLDRKISQDIVTGQVHLTPIQRRFFERNPVNHHHYNQAVMLYKENGFDEYITAAVFKKIVEHHDALRMVYRFQSNTIIQENRGLQGELFHFELVKIDTGVDIELEIEKEANRIQASINLTTGPLVHLGLFKTIVGDHLLIVVHHLAVDGISWRILLEDFTTGYQQIETGEEIKFQPKTDSFKYCSEKLMEYAESEKILTELNYWKRVEEMGMHGLPVDFEIPVEQRKAKNREIITIELDQKKTAILSRNAYRNYGAEIYDLLLAALAMALKQWCGMEKISIDLEGHGREEVIEEIDISRTVGWYTSRYPVLLDLSKATSLPEMIKHVKEIQMNIPNKGIGYGLLRYITKDEKKEGFKFSLDPLISFSYLGQFEVGGTDRDIFTISPLKTGDSISPEFEEKYMLNINGMMAAEGELYLSFSYNKHEYACGSIKELKDLYETNLLKTIAQ